MKEVIDYFDSSTADDSEPAGDGLESDERIESAALDLVKPKNAAQLQKELEYLERTIEMGESVRSCFEEAKFFKLRELIE